MNNNSQSIILGIESSCDDTAAAVLINGKIRSNHIASQEVHAQFGGVVPEWASRKHQQNIIPVVDLALKNAGVDISELDAIACTQGPGLLGSLLVGHTFAKGLSLALNKPLINVNHIEAHIWSHFIEDEKPEFPFLCLLVSGGHTQIVKITDYGQSEIIGTTLDDAVGEAFDKAGKMFGLPYPAGPEIDKLAQKGDPNKFSFSTSSVGDLDFSFSGLKTSVLYFLQAQKKVDPDFVEKNSFDLCASLQHTIVSYLMSKLMKAVEQTGIKQIGIAGGVAANSALRSALESYAAEIDAQAFIPKFEYCTDNAAMIAKAGEIKWAKNELGTLRDICYARND
ncbi:tRNA (adenosine(37)-N6)-threonylcarbamoyltransferase complex transferase subunit TsaD [bacterium]|nr:tRNA (adenosine(37)-N6)-threonylcarbamoyltransferase complex transferase subunit TsaD [bacterium]